MSWHASLHVYSCLTLLKSHTLQAAERGSASPERASLVHVSARLAFISCLNSLAESHLCSQQVTGNTCPQWMHLA